MTRYFRNLSLHKPLVMGIINVTPDSFSDGGDFLDHKAAIERGLEMREEGADIIDIGGESTRPGAHPIEINEEIRRVIPVVEGLAKCGAVISVDTRHSEVMKLAVESGAGIINDVSALSSDPVAIDLIARLGVAVILMHMQGVPGTMQENPMYDNAPIEIKNYLSERIKTCEAAGIKRTNMAIDPGIGVGKSLQHNLDILNRLELLIDLGCPIVLGSSRKNFLGLVAKEKDPKQRLAGSLATAVIARGKGAQVFRVHDVRETRQALDVAEAISNAKI